VEAIEVSQATRGWTIVIGTGGREQQNARLKYSKNRRQEMYGFGRGRGSGRGMGFGFRGASPPWPYVGRGRGGLPRCGYYLGGAAAFPRPVYGAPFYDPVTAAPGYAPYATPASGEEIRSLRGQAEAMKTELDGIESRIRDLEGKRD